MRTASFAFAVLAAVNLVAAQNFTIDVLKCVKCTRKTKNRDVIAVNYNLTLKDDTLVDSSYNDNSSDPFSFTVGAGQVVKGWDLGLLDMCIGDQRKLTIPPHYGYGNKAYGPIPGNSTLIFYTELEGFEGVFERYDKSQETSSFKYLMARLSNLWLRVAFGGNPSWRPVQW